jgi:osmotically inducible protein OsmC
MADTPYGFNSRFGDLKGTNPEELIAAAHAGCFAMALSGELAGAGFKPEQLDAKSEVSLENIPGKGWNVTASHLILKGKVPGIDAAKFAELADKAKNNCPISKLLKGTIAITLDAQLV